MSDHYTKEGGAAFPVPQVVGIHSGEIQQHSEIGMTLRQWYAGKFLAGFMASSGSMRIPPSPAAVSALAFQFADAMIAAGKKT